MSEVLRGKRKLSKNLALRISKRLCFDPQETLRLQDAFDPATGAPAAYKKLDLDHFRMISDWYHFAIRSLSETRGYRHDPAWISKRLGIPPQEARSALERLARLGLMEVDSKSRVTRHNVPVTTSDDVADLSLRKVHAQNLELARRSL